MKKSTYLPFYDEDMKYVLEHFDDLVLKDIDIQKRFWPIDNTDINRMFPGYNLGETTQRIADGVFKEIMDYQYGIQSVLSVMKFLSALGIIKYNHGEDKNIIHPYDGKILETLYAPADSKIFFMHTDPLTYANTAVFKLI